MIFETDFNWALLAKARDVSFMRRIMPADAVVSKSVAYNSGEDTHTDETDASVSVTRGLRVIFDPTTDNRGGARRCRDWLKENDIHCTMRGRYRVTDNGMSIDREFVGAVFKFRDDMDAFHFHLAFGGVLN